MLKLVTVLQASTVAPVGYERPANQGISTQATRAEFGQVYFDKYMQIRRN